MKKIAAALAAIALLSSATARAGVVMEEEEVINAGPGHAPATHKRTVMVEGRKERMETAEHTMIIDLDKGQMTMLNATSKTYIETAFPPTGPMSQMIKSMVAQNLNYKKTGNQRTVAGYKCADYDSSGKTPNAVFSTTACYSEDAPGAAEFSAFQKAVATKLGATGSTELANLPGGVPLAIHSTHKMTGFSMPGMPPEQAKKLSEMMANRPPIVSDSTVTKITARSLPADTFAVPAGYTKREAPERLGTPIGPKGPGMGSGMPMAPGSGMPPGMPMGHPPVSGGPQ